MVLVKEGETRSAGFSFLGFGVVGGSGARALSAAAKEVFCARNGLLKGGAFGDGAGGGGSSDEGQAPWCFFREPPRVAKPVFTSSVKLVMLLVVMVSTWLVWP